jgi:hypothetical protein
MNPNSIDLGKSRVLVGDAYKYPACLWRYLQFCFWPNSKVIANALRKDDSPGFIDPQLSAIS